MPGYEIHWITVVRENKKQLIFNAGRSSNGSEPLMPINTEYPILFDEQILKRFNAKIKEINNMPVNTKFVVSNPFEDELWGHEATKVILSKLQLNKSIEWGYENEKYQSYLIRKKELKQIKKAI